MPINHAPVWEIDGLTLNGLPDAEGIQWIATSDSDPLSTSAPTTTYTAKYNRIGSYWLPGHVDKGTSTFTIRAYALNKSWATLRRASLKMLALCQDTTKLYPLVFHSEIGNLVQNVVRDGDILIKPVQAQHPAFEASVQLAAPDPRRYAESWQELVTGVPRTSPSGLDFGTLGSTGLDFGSGSTGSVLNANPYFETNVANWTPTAGTFTRSTSQHHEGSASGLLTPDGSGNTAYVQSEQISVSAGADYQFSMWARCATARYITLNVNWFDSIGSYVTTTADIGGTTVTANTWTSISGTTTAPAGAAFASLVPTLYSPASASGFLYVDEVTLRPSFVSSTGLDFGPASLGGTVIADNTSGTAPAPLFLRLTGPLTTPVITVADGSIQYNDTLAAGEFVEFDPEAPSALLGGTASRGYLTNPANWSAFVVQPGETLTIGLSHSGASTDLGTLTVRFRPAFW